MIYFWMFKYILFLLLHEFFLLSFAFFLICFSRCLYFFPCFHKMYCGIFNINIIFMMVRYYFFYFKWFSVFNNKTIIQLSQTSVCAVVESNSSGAAGLVFKSYPWLFLPFLFTSKTCPCVAPGRIIYCSVLMAIANLFICRNTTYYCCAVI
jgi:hypothetical protein